MDVGVAVEAGALSGWREGEMRRKSRVRREVVVGSALCHS
jgi:hypothetical protein